MHAGLHLRVLSSWARHGHCTSLCAPIFAHAESGRADLIGLSAKGWRSQNASSQYRCLPGRATSSLPDTGSALFWVGEWKKLVRCTLGRNHFLASTFVRATCELGQHHGFESRLV